MKFKIRAMEDQLNDGPNKTHLRLRSDADRFATEFGWSTSNDLEEIKSVLYERGLDSILVNFNGIKADSFFADINKETIYRKGLSIYNLRSVFENPELRTWVSWTITDTLEKQNKSHWIKDKK